MPVATSHTEMIYIPFDSSCSETVMKAVNVILKREGLFELLSVLRLCRYYISVATSSTEISRTPLD